MLDINMQMDRPSIIVNYMARIDFEIFEQLTQIRFDLGARPRSTKFEFNTVIPQ